MEECLKQGLTRSIGISNFNSKQVERLLQHCTIKPVVNEVEVNTSINQRRLIKFCNDRGIAIVGYTPLGKHKVLMKYIIMRNQFKSINILEYFIII